MDNISVIEKSITFKEIEEKIYKTVCNIACEIMKKVLEEIDRRLMVERNSKELRNKGFKHNCIKTVMGNVEFDRRIYKFTTEEGKTAYKYLLDEYLQMNSIGHMSLNLIDRIVENITDLSFRKTANNIEKLSNQSISHTGVWNIVQKLGNIIEEIDKNKVNKNKQGKLNGNKECTVLFQEMDGLWINMQGKDRTKSGKSRKKEIKLGAIYEGWRKRKSNENEDEVVGKTVYATFENSKKFKELGEATIAEIYNVDEIETRIINGDGASWIKEVAKEGEGIYYQLDPFHRSQAIVRWVSDKKERKN